MGDRSFITTEEHGVCEESPQKSSQKFLTPFIHGYAFTAREATKTRGHFYAVSVKTALSLSRTLVASGVDFQRIYLMIIRIVSLSAVCVVMEVLCLTGRGLWGSMIRF